MSTAYIYDVMLKDKQIWRVKTVYKFDECI